MGSLLMCHVRRSTLHAYRVSSKPFVYFTVFIDSIVRVVSMNMAARLATQIKQNILHILQYYLMSKSFLPAPTPIDTALLLFRAMLSLFIISIAHTAMYALPLSVPQIDILQIYCNLQVLFGQMCVPCAGAPLRNNISEEVVVDVFHVYRHAAIVPWKVRVCVCVYRSMLAGPRLLRSNVWGNYNLQYYLCYMSRDCIRCGCDRRRHWKWNCRP